MQAITLLTLFVALFGSSYTLPLGAELFPGFYGNANLANPNKEAEITKRLAVDPNPDAALKQISLQNFIGNLEQSLFQSAQSVSHVGQSEQFVPEVFPAAAPATEHTLSKRNTIGAAEVTTSAATNAIASTTEPYQVLLQTTKKIPENQGIPAHILIDRIAVQPHKGNIALIPAFQLQHSKFTTATLKDPTAAGQPGDATQISITKTTIKATNIKPIKEDTSESETPVPPVTTEQSVEKTQLIKDAASENQAASSTVVPTNAGTTLPAALLATTETTLSTTSAAAGAKHDEITTTPKPSVILKKAEDELKEKVAEIEAEPVILSARV